jgi:nitrite reductase/ring-hydroxylating ferredoxin subunit
LGDSAVLQIPYRKVIPYPFAVVLDQYFDFEHIAHVHPTTLGEYVLVENSGRRIVYDQLWPADRKGRRATSRVVQTFDPPGDIRFEFVAGKHRGTRVSSQLRPHPDGTEVSETYHVPGLPNWGLLRRLIAPAVYRQVDRIWDEDLRAGVCIGGWPGTPGLPSRVDVQAWRQPLKPGVYRLGSVEKFALGSLTVVDTPGGAVLIAHTAHGVRATHPTCPHTGGPLGLGKADGACLVCPWHGARFDAGTGQAVSGPTRIPLPVYAVRVEDGNVLVEA